MIIDDDDVISTNRLDLYHVYGMTFQLQMNNSFKKPWECGDLELVPLDTKVTSEALLRHPRGVAGLSRMVGAESRDLVPLLKDPVDWEAGMDGRELLSFYIIRSQI